MRVQRTVLPSIRRLASRFLPWLVTVVVLALMFWRTPFGGVLLALRGAAAWTLPAGLLGMLAVFLADTAAMKATFGWFVGPLRFWDALVIRGATYLLAAINYGVGQGAIVYLVHRAAGLAFDRAIGAVLLIAVTNLLLLVSLAAVGLWLAFESAALLYVPVLAACAGALVYVLAIAIKPNWLRTRRVIDVLFGAGLGGHGSAMLVRLPHLLALLAFNYAMLHAFSVRVPWTYAMLTLPIVFFIVALPISVHGLGTSQAAMVFFFSRYASGPAEAREAVVLACSLAGQVIGLGFQSLVGVVCLQGRLGRLVRWGAPLEPTRAGPSEPTIARPESCAERSEPISPPPPR